MALHAAVLRCDRETLAELLENGDVDPIDKNERTPLSLAAEIGDKRALDLLLKKGAAPGSTDNEGQSPLAYAARKGHAEIIHMLLDKGADPGSKNAAGKSPIVFAATGGFIEIVELLLENGADPGSKNAAGESPLFFAAERGFIEIVELLLENGAYLEARSKSMGDIPPLLGAIRNGHTEVVELLLGKGADLEVRSGWDSASPLEYASNSGYIDIVELLLAKGADIESNAEGISPLSWASAKGHTDIVELLLAEGANIESRNSNGKSPMFFAAERGQMEVIELLLSKGANPHLKDSKGRSIISIAAGNHHSEIVERLLQGTDLQAEFLSAVKIGNTELARLLSEKDIVDLNNASVDGRTTLSFAAENGHTEVIRLLLAKGVDLDSECTTGNNPNDGRTPLFFAVGNGHEEAIRLLLAGGADPNARDSRERTPISIASEKGQDVAVDMLLANDNVEAGSRDQNNWTPLSWAAACDRGHVVNLLLGREDVNPDSQDNQGRTPLSLAAERGHYAVVKSLARRGNPNISDKDGRTPLWLATEKNDKRIAVLLARSNSVTMHMLVQAGLARLAQFLLDSGYDFDVCDEDGVTPLRLAVQLKRPELIELLLKYSACMEGIYMTEWAAAYSGEQNHTLQLLEGQTGENSIKVCPEKSPQKPADARRQLLVFGDHSNWQEVPFTHAKEKMEPNQLQISQNQGSDDKGMSFCMSLLFLVEKSTPHARLENAINCEIRIAWTIVPPSAPNNQPWRSIDHYSLLPYGWIPGNGIEFFMQFMLYLTERWLELCDSGEKSLDETRLDQLNSEGKNTEMMRRLARDAKKWAELRRVLQSQFRVARKFATDYCRRYNANQSSKYVQQLGEFESEIANHIGQLDQTVRELLQIFAWAAITESRISTRLGQNVMLLTYVSIFYLPLAYCAALWAIPNILDTGTQVSFIISSVVVALVTLILAFNLENLSGLVGRLYHNWRAKLVRDMKNDSRWKERGDKLQQSVIARERPSEWLLVGYVMHKIARMLDKKQPDKDDEESKLPP